MIIELYNFKDGLGAEVRRQLFPDAAAPDGSDPEGSGAARAGEAGGGAADVAKEVTRAAAIVEGRAPSTPGVDFRSVVEDMATMFPAGLDAKVLVAAKGLAAAARKPGAGAVAIEVEHLAADVATRRDLSRRQRLEVLAGALAHALADETRPEAREAALRAFASVMTHEFDAMRDLLADDEEEMFEAEENEMDAAFHHDETASAWRPALDGADVEGTGDDEPCEGDARPNDGDEVLSGKIRCILEDLAAIIDRERATKRYIDVSFAFMSDETLEEELHLAEKWFESFSPEDVIMRTGDFEIAEFRLSMLLEEAARRSELTAHEKLEQAARRSRS